MIDEIQLPSAYYGATIKFVYRSLDTGMYWNQTSSAYEAYNPSNQSQYYISAVELPAGTFTATRPGGVTLPTAIKAWRYVDGTATNDYIVGSGADEGGESEGTGTGPIITPEPQTLTFTRVIRVGGVLTDADTTPQITIIRLDTGAVVVPTADMVHDSTGVYSYTLSSPENNVVYRAVYTIVVNGQTITSSSDQAVSNFFPLSPYFTWQQFIDRFGLKNVTVASNKQNSNTDPNLSAIQESFDYAYEEISTAMAGGVYTSPLDFSGYNGVVPVRIRRWAMIIAYWDLYTERGMDDRDKYGTKMTRLYQNVLSEMQLVRNGMLRINAALAVDYTGEVVNIGPRGFGAPCGYQFVNGVIVPGGSNGNCV